MQPFKTIILFRHFYGAPSVSAVTGTPMPNGTWISSSVQALKFRKDRAFVGRSNLENAYYMILSEKRLQRKLYVLSVSRRKGG